MGAVVRTEPQHKIVCVVYKITQFPSECHIVQIYYKMLLKCITFESLYFRTLRLSINFLFSYYTISLCVRIFCCLPLAQC